MVGLGFSCHSNPESAVRAAVGEAVRGSGAPTLTFVFSTDEYEPDRLIGCAADLIHGSALIGACVPGILVDGSLYRSGVGVCAVAADAAVAATHLERDIGADPGKSGLTAGRQLLESGVTSGTVFIFPDGFASNISEFLRGVYGAMGPAFTYVGGGTGDNLRFHRTYQYTESGVTSGGAALAVVQGIRFGTAVGHGWRAIGQPLMVTKAAGKRVYELDGIPAMKRYCSVVGPMSREDFPRLSMAHPLGITAAQGEFLIRDPLQVEDDDSIVFITEIPQNTVATIMAGDSEDLIGAARMVARRAAGGTVPEVALLFDCVSRYLLMDQDFNRELEAITGALPPRTPTLGVLTFGEISDALGSPLFYNKSIVIAAGC